ncbi:MAG TPA: amino acid carrier protein [Clostridia bacterium]|nr:amino acid carrier protein [Clostridia bacterium]
MLLEHAAGALWGPFTMALILGLGGYLTVKTRFFSLRSLPQAFKNIVGDISANRKEKRDVSAFMAMSTALGATMGTGNIVGVATAVVAGGPGAVVWMQLAALAGMMIKFAEVALAVKYKRQGSGPMGYLHALGKMGSVLAVLFAISCVAASLGTGNMTQSNSATQALHYFSVSPMLCAVALGLFTWVATGKGVRGIMLLSAWIVPIITVGYLLLSIAAVWQGRANLFNAVGDMFAQAFGLRAAAGGTIGYTVRSAMRFGLARGVFSNEAGMGSSPIAHSQSDCSEPVTQGMWGILEVLIDTTLSCTLTALVLLTADSGKLLDGVHDGAALAIRCFSTLLGEQWGALVAVFIALFGVTSVCGWYTYGKTALQYLLPKSNMAPKLFRLLYAVGVSLGALWSVRKIWILSDLLTGLMMVFNMSGLLFLSQEVPQLVRTYDRKRKG